MKFFWVVLFFGLLAFGCKGQKQAYKPLAHQAEKDKMNIQLKSTAFVDGKNIPKKYSRSKTESGENLSPPLSWKGVPSGTKSLALICHDPDAPSPKNPMPNPWVHWVIYNISPTKTSLAEGMARDSREATQGKNSWNALGYDGPEPPKNSGAHRYVFQLYALDLAPSLPSNLTSKELRAKMKGHILAWGHLVGYFER